MSSHPPAPPNLHHAASEPNFAKRGGAHAKPEDSAAATQADNPSAATSMDDLGVDALAIEDEDGKGVKRSASRNLEHGAGSGSAHAEDGGDALVDGAHKDSFFSFLKGIIGKDVDQMRVSVPLWLLEPVSNLEYLAELDHLEYFTRAPLLKTPEERIVSILTMLLASLKKALRKAKKPINPILSELHYVHFDADPNDDAPAAAGGSTATITAASAANNPEYPPVHLIGEQVSHHPPISAFHAQCPTTGVETTLLYDVKAKFNGLSFALQNHSHAQVRIPKLGETYHINYPNASLVGVLSLNFRLMWAGECSVECEKTGLKAAVTFKEKRWFGKETYDVAGTVFKMDNPKKALATISGAWNSAIFIQYAGAPAPSVLYDATTMHSPYRMHVAPDHLAPENSSRRVWGEVMAAMRAGDANKATKLKTDVENKQRVIAKERADGKRDAYVPLFFKYDPDAPVGPGDTGRCEYIGGPLPVRGTDVREYRPPTTGGN